MVRVTFRDNSEVYHAEASRIVFEGAFCFVVGFVRAGKDLERLVIAGYAIDSVLKAELLEDEDHVIEPEENNAKPMMN